MSMHKALDPEVYTYGGAIKVGLIPDTHWCPTDKKASLLVADILGKYMKAEQPDVIVHIGDANDAGSLSSYDKGKASIEGKRLAKEMQFSRQCLDVFRDALGGHDAELIMTEGNHDGARVSRMYDDEPAMHGVLGDDIWGYEAAGWYTLPFLQIVDLNNVAFSHYFQNPTSVMGSPIGGTIDNCLKNVGHSFVQGHVQTLKSGMMPTATGKFRCGLIAGACYTSDHGYKGVQGNRHWRGACMLDNLNDGYFDLSTMGIRSMIKRYK